MYWLEPPTTTILPRYKKRQNTVCGATNPLTTISLLLYLLKRRLRQLIPLYALGTNRGGRYPTSWESSSQLSPFVLGGGGGGDGGSGVFEKLKFSCQVVNRDSTPVNLAGCDGGGEGSHGSDHQKQKQSRAAWRHRWGQVPRMEKVPPWNTVGTAWNDEEKKAPAWTCSSSALAAPQHTLALHFWRGEGDLTGGSRRGKIRAHAAAADT